VRSSHRLCAAVALGLLGSLASAQEPTTAKPAKASAAAPEAAGLKVGPATIAPHWSRNVYPTTVPEGAIYYIVERGDTLWDISKKYLGNPYLWPQIWDQNKYVSDAHWIYPGDPLVLPKVSLVTERAGESGPGTGEEEGGQGGTETASESGPKLSPVTEEATLQCADYIANGREDESLKIIGSEEGADKVAFGDRDVLYLNKGSNAGIKAGDVYTMHHALNVVKHPATRSKLGTKIETTGWGQVILVDENSATVVVEQACADIHAGDYLRPIEKVNVPLVLDRAYPDRLTPPSGKLTNQYVVDIQGDATIAGAGNLVTIDAGSEGGVAPGNIFVIYRTVYPSVPSPRNVLGELAVVAVRDRTATAKITYSRDAVMIGDQIELR
jgi:LysM repeat protein